MHAPTQGSWPSGQPGRRPVSQSLAVLALALTCLAVASGLLGGGSAAAQEGQIDARVGSGAPGSWDPAQAGDITSAAVLSQVFVGLTEFDADSNVQPGLAQSWTVEEGGRRIVFRLRDGLQFSDGSPLTAQDVVFSWLRLLEPAHRSPLASLLDDVAGAAAYGRGESAAGNVGIRADGNRLVVELRRPAAYFVSITAAAPLAVVSRTSPPPDTETLPANIVVSGAYRPTAQTDTGIDLQANPNYWPGQAPLARIRLVTDLKGKNPVAAFDDGDMDFTGVQAFDAAWLRYDHEIGSRLREIPSFGVFYYGFDTTRPPFNDRRVRQAFAQAVDWHRLVRLSDPTAVPATSLMPAALPGRGPGDFSPRHDPAAARTALAAAGFPGGRGFPAVTLVSGGSNYDDGVLHELKQNLGITVGLERRPFDEYFDRLGNDPPQFWNLSWIADYPAPQDFLGLLAETGSGNNYGHWSNAAYDAALTAAAATSDATEQRRHYDEAQRILRDEAPLIPVSYGQGWALSNDLLLGATPSGVGFLRLAGLKWANR